MIVSFACKDTAELFDSFRSKRWRSIERSALRKLVLVDTATSLGDLRVPPGNRLEALAGDRVGQHAIRINDQWRLVFRWEGDDALDVAIVDYH